MATPPRYWTPAFIEAFVEALNEDADFQKAVDGFTDTVVLRCFDTPDGMDVEASYAFEDGEVTDVSVWIDEAPCQDMRAEPFDKKAALGRATAPYEVWTKLDRGEMSVLQAIASPDYQIEGPKLKILANLGVFTGMNEVAAHVEKTY
jgi:putative sterol carrier protein